MHRPGPRYPPPRHRAALGITEQGAYGIVNDLTEAGYVIKEKEGRRNRYQVKNTSLCPKPPIKNRRSGRCSA